VFVVEGESEDGDETGGVMETIISRHSMAGVSVDAVVSGWEEGDDDGGDGEDGDEDVFGVAFGAGAGADWKVWMGRASKNSWATMKGVLSDSVNG
jgi:hypothetical protein